MRFPGPMRWWAHRRRSETDLPPARWPPPLAAAVLRKADGDISPEFPPAPSGPCPGEAPWIGLPTHRRPSCQGDGAWVLPAAPGFGTPDSGNSADSEIPATPPYPESAPFPFRCKSAHPGRPGEFFRTGTGHGRSEASGWPGTVRFCRSRIRPPGPQSRPAGLPDWHPAPHAPRQSDR